MPEVMVGKVVKYFLRPSAAIIELTDGSLKVGDTILIRGHTTDFQQEVDSIQIEGEPIQEAERGKAIGIKVKERVRPKDAVYKITE